MDSSTTVSKVSTDNKALVANESSGVTSVVTKLQPTATINDMPNEILVKIMSFAISKPVLNYNENLQNFEVHDKPECKLKRQPNSITDYETAQTLSKVSGHFEKNVLQACIARGKNMNHTSFKVTAEILDIYTLDTLTELVDVMENGVEGVECEYKTAVEGIPEGWPRQNPLACRHCLLCCRYEFATILEAEEVALVRKDAIKLKTVCTTLAERSNALRTRQWQDFIIANKHRFDY